MLQTGDLSEEAWDSWCITEAPLQRRSRARPPRLPPTSRCGSGCAMYKDSSECSTRASSVCGQSRPSSASRSSSRCSSVGRPRGSVDMSKVWIQEALCSQLSVPRRQRLVQSTLEATRGDYDPTVGLEAAARDSAAGLILRTLHQHYQQERCASLATPRDRPVAAAPSRPRRLPSLDSASERLKELAQPRQLKVPPPAEAPPASACSPSWRRARLAELAQPRAQVDITNLLAEISLAERFPLESSSEFASAVINDVCTEQTPQSARSAMLEAYGAGLDEIWRRAKRLCKIGGSEHLRSSSEPPHSARN
eukprot:TRINITY_DN48023_c0_g1_i1.p1 TRINITY_DN48023_c0_g1~~TRINITY_DN48023_c0_g1_i1.p1  ORF type:complete len:308 (-),score=40.92 TRINITY_DN48023_c0_g1_i1:149-1072(-)